MQKATVDTSAGCARQIGDCAGRVCTADTGLRRVCTAYRGLRRVCTADRGLHRECTADIGLRRECTAEGIAQGAHGR